MTRYEERRMARHVYAVGVALARIMLALHDGRPEEVERARGLADDMERDYRLLVGERPERGVEARAVADHGA